MGRDYDNEKYPGVKAVSVEAYMRSTKMEELGGATFPWESKAHGS